ncbi:hypothetical protein PHYBOEH_005283 [Phytophthora boehmeriae]|uniref:Uncharacterized protein n=1 Tax=Phytophthora boehmeriae TaxID=109152 RepID=A0A8T1WMC4_9STRA|nr:hypothetical protein PHYBOEH_005283 [Phytophthora boehmeriae]
MSGDALDRELALLADTISQQSETSSKREADYTKTLPKKFVLTEPQNAKKDFAVVAAAAKNPTQPMRPNLLLHEDGSRGIGSDNACSREDLANRAGGIPTPRVPLAKRGHMDGVLMGVPGGMESLSTVQQRSFVYDSEMKEMNRDKDVSHHRKRDAYSEYVEARARFSKMHSVT